jgi:hypothetical protein
MSRERAVGTATGHGLEGRGIAVQVPMGDRNIHFLMHSRPSLGPTSYLSSGCWVVLSWGQRGREAKLTHLQLYHTPRKPGYIMKNDVFWDVTPRGSCKNRRFGGS